MYDCNNVNSLVQQEMHKLIREGHKGKDLEDLLKIFYNKHSCKQPHSHSQAHSHQSHSHQPHSHQAHQSHSQHPDPQHPDPHKDPPKVTEPVIENSNDIDKPVRLVMMNIIFWLFLRYKKLDISL